MQDQISILVEKHSWIAPYAGILKTKLTNKSHEVSIVYEQESIPSGWINFILGYTKIIPEKVLKKNIHNLVVHESDLPLGRGFSPMTWQILEGKNDIPICLLEAENLVDSGGVWLRDTISLEGDEICNEWRARQGEKTIDMCVNFVDNHNSLNMEKQKGECSTYRRRKPADSEIDANKTIAEQFNLLRVVDNDRYPAFFDYKGRRYKLTISVDDGQ